MKTQGHLYSGVGSYGLYSFSSLFVILGVTINTFSLAKTLERRPRFKKKSNLSACLPYLAVALGYVLLLKLFMSNQRLC